MVDGQRQETEWEGLRLVIKERPTYWQVFVYDTEKCEVLYAVSSSPNTPSPSHMLLNGSVKVNVRKLAVENS
jgi:hypothetical protein